MPYPTGRNYSPASRRSGPINVLKYINGQRISGVGDIIPIKGMLRLTPQGQIGGIRMSFNLPTDKVVKNFPIANSQNTKDLMSAIRRNIKERRNANKPIVILQNRFNQLDWAQTPNIMPGRFPWEPDRYRGEILSSFKGPRRSTNMMYRMQTAPQTLAVTDEQDNVTNKDVGPTGNTNHPPISVDAKLVKQNPVLMANVQDTPPTNTNVNPTLFFIGALVLAFLVLRK